MRTTSLDMFIERNSKKGTIVGWEETVSRTKALCDAIAAVAKETDSSAFSGENLFETIYSYTPSEPECTDTALLSSIKTFITSSSVPELELTYRIIRQAYQNFTYSQVYRMRLMPADYYRAASAEFAPWHRVEPTASILLECFLGYTDVEDTLSLLERMHVAESTGILAKKGVKNYASLQSALHKDFWERFDSDDLYNYHPGPANFVFNMGRPLYFAYACYMVACELVKWGFLSPTELPPEAPTAPAPMTCPWNQDCANCGVGSCH